MKQDMLFRKVKFNMVLKMMINGIMFNTGSMNKEIFGKIGER